MSNNVLKAQKNNHYLLYRRGYFCHSSAYISFLSRQVLTDNLHKHSRFNWWLFCGLHANLFTISRGPFNDLFTPTITFSCCLYWISRKCSSCENNLHSMSFLFKSTQQSKPVHQTIFTLCFLCQYLPPTSQWLPTSYLIQKSIFDVHKTIFQDKQP